MPTAVKQGRKGRKIGRALKKCEKYRNAGTREKNKKREKKRLERHLLLAKARRARNHADRASDADKRALEKLAK